MPRTQPPSPRTAGSRGEGAPPRPVIDASWRRVSRDGVVPGQGTESERLDREVLEGRRRTSALREVLPELGRGLAGAAQSAGQVMIVADTEGRVLWRSGDRRTLRLANTISLAEGAAWEERATGTNAIGTALATGSAVQVHGGEHFVRVLHRWTCAAAPLHDPRDGELLGVVDLSGPRSTFHPATLALVQSVTRLAESELRLRHLESVEVLRAVAAPLLSRIGGPALVVDPQGWVAGATGLTPPRRLPLPAAPGDSVDLPGLGPCAVEPLPGGWLLRVREEAPEDGDGPGRIVLDLTGGRRAVLTVAGGAGGSWSARLSPRHAEILYVLAVHREGRTAAQLALDLFGDAGRTVTVRAELSRLRRTLHGVLDHRPYRFRDGWETELRLPSGPGDLLPASRSPLVVRGRGVCDSLSP
ncbi:MULTISPECIES: GAF domain-containing protein [Streptomyces]|uniref:GAF domain-containing protein n=2 Tax=Streptomyces TaxID=1883 RepID=A0ABU2R740_9ACTN|nr:MULTISPECIES: GAF domain-containing protein [unclassified Streptomyces]MDT0412512.1 GAF domain-containing protein [Streptomyces sp. DSM 41979]MDT0421292.1 GAF domain-containing protein [Streptomyces sp. DSM 41859]MYQ60374.1 GAF domain-containing protein [Streptomyces sp. SID4926]